MDNCKINNLAKNQVSSIFHLRAIRRSVLPKFTELYMETPCAGWAQRGRRQETKQKHLLLSFATRKSLEIQA